MEHERRPSTNDQVFHAVKRLDLGYADTLAGRVISEMRDVCSADEAEELEARVKEARALVAETAPKAITGFYHLSCYARMLVDGVLPEKCFVQRLR